MFPLLIGSNVVYQRRVDELLRRAPRTSSASCQPAVHESFDGRQLVKSFGAEQRETERLADDRRPAARRAGRAPSRIRGTFEALLDGCPTLTNVAARRGRRVPGAERRR